MESLLELIWKTEKDVLNDQKDLFQSITYYLVSSHVWSDNKMLNKNKGWVVIDERKMFQTEE